MPLAGYTQAAPGVGSWPCLFVTMWARASVLSPRALTTAFYWTPDWLRCCLIIYPEMKWLKRWKIVYSFIHIFITCPPWKGTKSLLFALDLFPEWLIENIFHSNILPSKLSQISSLWNMKIIYQFDACPHSRNRHLPDFNKKKYFLCMQILVRQSRHTNSK